MKTDARTFLELIVTLEQRGDIKVLSQSTAGRPNRRYQLTEGVKEGSEVKE
jgi:predicted ArsR family transcriptional regulator